MSTQKEVYTTPTLTVHGTVEQITRDEDPIPGKEPQMGDGAQQWPYGKIDDYAEDALRARSRS